MLSWVTISSLLPNIADMLLVWIVMASIIFGNIPSMGICVASVNMWI